MWRIKLIDEKGETFQVIETDISLPNFFKRQMTRQAIALAASIEITKVKGTSPWEVNTAILTPRRA